jgi:DNA processing protein
MTVVDNLDATVPTKARMANPPVLGVLRGDPLYPERLLRAGARPPDCLFVRGSLPSAGRVIAVVGARAASIEGCAVTAQLTGELGRRGYAVVSGGAIGIDAAAHRGALEALAPTFAVLGCGADVVYPDRHAHLFNRIVVQGGGLLSEYADGTPPRRGNFPARNRLIAALADAVVVVEAGLRSGALSTAAWGRKLGVPVLAMPGSAGTDRLLAARRARAVRRGPLGAQDVLDRLAGRTPEGLPDGGGNDVGENDAAGDDGPLAPVLAALRAGTADPQELARRLTWPLARVLSLLSQAEVEGRVRRLPGAQYEVTRVH